MSQEETENRESNEDSATTNEDLKDVPDGGWGWFVVAGVFLVIIQGSSYSNIFSMLSVQYGQ